MINGFHTIVYSDNAEATRAFFRDVLGWPSVPTHQSSLMCDDIEATCAELRSQGVTVRDEIKDEGFGLTSSIDAPGAGWMMLYQPRHELADELDR